MLGSIKPKMWLSQKKKKSCLVNLEIKLIWKSCIYCIFIKFIFYYRSDSENRPLNPLRKSPDKEESD